MPHEDILDHTAVFTKTIKAIREAGSQAAFCRMHGIKDCTLSAFLHDTREKPPKSLIEAFGLEPVWRVKRRKLPSKQIAEINTPENEHG